MPLKKSNEALGIAGTRLSVALFDEMRACFDAHTLNLTGDKEFDIDSYDESRSADACLYQGYFQGHLRLAGLIKRETSGSTPEASVILVATNHDLVADPDLMTESDDDDTRRGNNFLVARCLHVVTFCLVGAGYHTLTCHPVHPTLETHYESMGFLNGTHLDLTSAARLRLTFGFVRQVYSGNGLTLAAPPVPF